MLIKGKNKPFKYIYYVYIKFAFQLKTNLYSPIHIFSYKSMHIFKKHCRIFRVAVESPTQEVQV